jgi:hypothetical protein
MAMKRPESEEPLLPPWVRTVALRLAVLGAVIVLYVLFTRVLNLPLPYLIPSLAVVGLAAAIYYGGRFYKPFHVNKDGKCVAGSAKNRPTCRHYMPGARLGGGCGRLRENGRCRYVR